MSQNYVCVEWGHRSASKEVWPFVAHLHWLPAWEHRAIKSSAGGRGEGYGVTNRFCADILVVKITTGWDKGIIIVLFCGYLYQLIPWFQWQFGKSDI